MSRVAFSQRNMRSSTSILMHIPLLSSRPFLPHRNFLRGSNSWALCDHLLLISRRNNHASFWLLSTKNCFVDHQRQYFSFSSTTASSCASAALSEGNSSSSSSSSSINTPSFSKLRKFVNNYFRLLLAKQQEEKMKQKIKKEGEKEEGGAAAVRSHDDDDDGGVMISQLSRAALSTGDEGLEEELEAANGMLGFVKAHPDLYKVTRGGDSNPPEGALYVHLLSFSSLSSEQEKERGSEERQKESFEKTQPKEISNEKESFGGDLVPLCTSSTNLPSSHDTLLPPMKTHSGVKKLEAIPLDKMLRLTVPVDRFVLIDEVLRSLSPLHSEELIQIHEEHRLQLAIQRGHEIQDQKWNRRKKKKTRGTTPHDDDEGEEYIKPELYHRDKLPPEYWKELRWQSHQTHWEKRRLGILFYLLEHPTMSRYFMVTPDENLVVQIRAGVQPPNAAMAMQQYQAHFDRLAAVKTTEQKQKEGRGKTSQKVLSSSETGNASPAEGLVNGDDDDDGLKLQTPQQQEEEEEGERERGTTQWNEEYERIAPGAYYQDPYTGKWRRKSLYAEEYVPTLTERWQKEIQVEKCLPFIPTFFVAWSFFMEKMPEEIKEAIGKLSRFRRAMFMVQKLRPFCEFSQLHAPGGAERLVRLRPELVVVPSNKQQENDIQQRTEEKEEGGKKLDDENLTHLSPLWKRRQVLQSYLMNNDATNANQYYQDLVYDEEAVLEMAHCLPLEAVPLCSASELFPETLRPWGGKKGGLSKLFKHYPFLFMIVNKQISSLVHVLSTQATLREAAARASSQPTKNAKEEEEEGNGKSDEGSSAAVVITPESKEEFVREATQTLQALSTKDDNGVEPEVFYQALSPVAKELVDTKFGGMGKLLLLFPQNFSLDANARFVVVPSSNDGGNSSSSTGSVSSVGINRIGTILLPQSQELSPSSDEEIDSFCSGEHDRWARKDKKKKERKFFARQQQGRQSRMSSLQREAYYDSTSRFADPDQLLFEIARYVPREGYIDLAYLSEDIPPEAKMYIPSSLLKYLRQHARVFHVKDELVGGSAKYYVRKRQAGEDFRNDHQTDNEYMKDGEDDDDHNILMAMSSLIPSEAGRSFKAVMSCLPMSCRDAMRAKAEGSCTKFVCKYPQYFRLVTARNLPGKNKLWVYLVQEPPKKTTKKEEGEGKEEENTTERNAEQNNNGDSG